VRCLFDLAHALGKLAALALQHLSIDEHAVFFHCLRTATRLLDFRTVA